MPSFTTVDESIAAYREVTLTGKCKYELYSDKIVINGSGTWLYDFEQELILTKISGHYARIRIRPSVAWIALTMCFLTGFACILLIYEFPIRSRALPGVLGIFSGSALIVAFATIRKVEYAKFYSEDYGSILL